MYRVSAPGPGCSTALPGEPSKPDDDRRRVVFVDANDYVGREEKLPGPSDRPWVAAAGRSAHAWKRIGFWGPNRVFGQWKTPLERATTGAES